MRLCVSLSRRRRGPAGLRDPLIPPCFYIHTFPGSLWPPTISRREKVGKTAATALSPNRFSSQFSTSRTNGPRLLSRVKADTHSPFGERSHTSSHTAKQGRFRWGRYYYPRTVSHVSETLRGQGVERQTLPLLGLGRVCSRRTQKAFGAAMRLCASLLRGVAAPLGCATLLLLLRSALKGSLQAVAETAENAYPPRTVRI